MSSFLIHTTAWLLAQTAVTTHVWRQLSSSSAPSPLPVTHKTDRRQRSGWRAGRERRRRCGITNPAARLGGHEPSERGTT